ncbi:uncharacterized protein [Lolium perenne]|uniref:uncharacterized protein isoform X2 n=1 Tax=Lolium perenne TaxID=4522 RepID=UPI0021F5724E|nr:uncharacterized protein LOC127299883 isoform X3 [Lolium perenne]
MASSHILFFLFIHCGKAAFQFRDLGRASRTGIFSIMCRFQINVGIVTGWLQFRYNYTYGDIDDSIESITHLPMLQVAADADAGVHDDDHQCLCPWPRCRFQVDPWLGASSFLNAFSTVSPSLHYLIKRGYDETFIDCNTIPICRVHQDQLSSLEHYWIAFPLVSVLISMCMKQNFRCQSSCASTKLGDNHMIERHTCT